MGAVYLAQDLQLQRPVAIKVPHLEMETDPVFVERFQREQEIGQKLDHPGLMKVFPDEHRSQRYMVMDWVEGRPLRLHSVAEAQRQGIVMVYQELNLVPDLTVAENLALGRVTVLRDGTRVATAPLSELTAERVVTLMVGREVRTFQRAPYGQSDVLGEFEVEAARLAPLNVRLRRSEIVGFAGVVGSGRSEALEAMFGLRGTARWKGQAVTEP